MIKAKYRNAIEERATPKEREELIKKIIEKDQRFTEEKLKKTSYSNLKMLYQVL